MAFFKQVLLHLVAIASVLSCGGLLGGCGKDSDGVDPADRLCGGRFAFAAAITGTPEPVEMCVSDQQTIADYFSHPQGDKYFIAASFTTDSLTIEIQMSFFVQSSTPRTLTLTPNQAEADPDRDAAWFSYREVKLNTYEYVASVVTGALIVTLSDQSLAAATFSGTEIQLDDASNGEPVGGRSISEGYVLVTGE